MINLRNYHEESSGTRVKILQRIVKGMDLGARSICTVTMPTFLRRIMQSLDARDFISPSREREDYMSFQSKFDKKDFIVVIASQG
mmetsp:Transcript_46285/g.140243  ORF Transcript_46285/g.140243 Transcript_46285/m.140243 type:complete len:85 (+) Transcript_46285:661-915(+)